MTVAMTALVSRWRRSILARSPRLRRLTISILLSATADQFSLIAIIWVVLQTTKSPAAVGTVVLCSRLPAVISAPLAGPRFDRGHAFQLIVSGYLIRAACMAAFPLAFALGRLNLTVILVLSIIIGAAYPFADIGVRMLVPKIVDDGDLPSANGMLSMGDQFPYLVGPVLGGAFVALAGASSLLLPAGACLLAALLLRAMRMSSSKGAEGEVHAEQRPAGWFGFRPLLSDRAVRALIVLTVVYFVSYGPLEPALPLLARDYLDAGATGYGMLWSAIGAGAIAGLVTVPYLGRRRPGVVNALGAMLWGAMLIPLVLVDALPPALLIAFLAGLAWAPYVTTEVSVIQRRVPAHHHGAVFGARKALLVVCSPTGAALGGLLLEHTTAPHVIALSAVTCILAGGICLALPSVRAVRPPPTATPHPAPAATDPSIRLEPRAGETKGSGT